MKELVLAFIELMLLVMSVVLIIVAFAGMISYFNTCIMLLLIISVLSILSHF